jgi:hypothetical protein
MATIMTFPHQQPTDKQAIGSLPYRTLALGLGRPPHQYLLSRTLGPSQATFVCYGWACGCKAIELGIDRCRARTCPKHVALLARNAPAAKAL